MRKFPIVIDLETKYTFREFTDPSKLGVSVAAIYDYKHNEGKIFLENELNKLFPILENSSYIIGFNNRSFDLQVLQPYYPGKLEKFAIFDILEDIKGKIGRRLSLNDMVSATLGKKKTGHGLMAIEYYKSNQWEKLKQYCLDDTFLTKDLLEFGAKHGEVYYRNEQGKIPIRVDWKKYLQEDSGNGNVALTLPF
ncbi:hypothetical protein COT62_03035 [Candidatus Roizmanbacteria bacterium CG09_land_8_20_14_0_10_41_9]|uniref:Uncharacterized protein n=1 Tax=Candidatus Roizmanbacteria bacterium CG09_land_8_20_14_0_10_41_9 TaxID=1974850 RepID=A0A2H0WUE3_9BACT|nr:MAG: hypothetical protein COT62_03035 [Candidatus Roizmanbacteria bacterium CG09_land_8_20_14_0_10_41_9]